VTTIDLRRACPVRVVADIHADDVAPGSVEVLGSASDAGGYGYACAGCGARSFLAIGAENPQPRWAITSGDFTRPRHRHALALDLPHRRARRLRLARLPARGALRAVLTSRRSLIPFALLVAVGAVAPIPGETRTTTSPPPEVPLYPGPLDRERATDPIALDRAGAKRRRRNANRLATAGAAR